MKLNMRKDLTPLKEQAVKDIDNKAEELRSKYITLGSGQAMIYIQKEKEADIVLADPEGFDPSHVPHIMAEANMNGITPLEQATTVKGMADLWRNLSPAIEVRRLEIKQAIAAARNPKEIEEAVQSPWEDILAGRGL